MTMYNTLKREISIAFGTYAAPKYLFQITVSIYDYTLSLLKIRIKYIFKHHMEWRIIEDVFKQF